MLRVHPRDECDLVWLFNEAEGDIKGIRSLHAATEARLNARAECKPASPFRFSERDANGRIFWHTTEDVGLRCGPVYVPSDELAVAASAPRIDGRCLAAAARERRIRRALEAAGPWAAHVLRLRYRERLPDCRIPFGYAGKAARRARPTDFAVGVRLNALRGAGAVAHLTSAAQLAHAAARTVLPIDRWIDQLGQRLAQGRASELDRQVGMDIARQAEVLVLRAYAAYRGGPGRVPEVVRRRARARAAEPVAAPAAAPAPVVLPLAA